ncbi:MAG: helix-hairpin-helix domain-containing protein [Flavobacteriales bacterium]|nr:helix-hairpin-helix domain-containing protein [Flavobacteriales bacterium]MBK7296598.1 helix-hairpin-helix domain-containing protein [Flavobacteriales bacterium]MBK9536133.1 helix-hairpin-helix domain-containing protein [Flavobacteriales bacterium]MBP9139449.1 helix-hairpin-helix domain-containing protein [Flavobacteriales bacterium]HQV53573.1 helix-hairpin-helix domain-containing protein [Flavobacteriales bacterium]
MAKKKQHRIADTRPLKEKLKDLGNLHAGERRGFFLIVLVLLIASAWVGYMKFVYEPSERDLTALKAEMETWSALRSAKKSLNVDQLAEPFPFDPNTIERSEWIALGLSERQVDGIERYVTKGGEFRSKKDVERMYTISPEMYVRLEPYILLPDSYVRAARPPYEKKQWPKYSKDSSTYVANDRYTRKLFTKTEVNTADSITLVGLPGIGPSFARGIIKYRDMLGGFHSLDQLEEVYVLRDKPDAIARIKDLLTLDPNAVHYVPINSCTVEQLAEHPYARWKIAKPLIAYRSQHGPFAKIEDIQKCVLVTDSVYDRLAPYLRLE